MNGSSVDTVLRNWTRVLLVDEHALFRHGVALILSAQPDFEVVGEAGNGLEAVAKVRELPPDLALMGITMPGCDGIAATRLIKREFPYIRVVILTMHDKHALVVDAMLAGAQGYLLKRSTSAEMLALLRRAVAGETVFDPSLTADEGQSPCPVTSMCHPKLASLTPREREVLQSLAHGATDQEIGHRLNLSRHTVKRHVSSLLSKLNVGNRREAAKIAQASDAPAKREAA